MIHDSHKQENSVYLPVYEWFQSMGWKAFPFQQQAWDRYFEGGSALVNAPTGSGKTYSVLLAPLMEALDQNEHEIEGVRIVWVTPIRALTKEIAGAAERAISALGLSWRVGMRTGDSTQAERKELFKRPPQILVTTPESVHVLLCQRQHAQFFKELRLFVADEWHELVGSKRGVQVELALSRLRTISGQLRIWGISATIGNMEEAAEVLLGPNFVQKDPIIRSSVEKKITIESVLPNQIDQLPWAGHLGIRLLQKVVPIIHNHSSTLIFTNTRSQCEIWYQRLLDTDPMLAGQIAMHHGSISRELRDWVEDALHEGKLKAVVCTSSLDLGVDFRPVEAIVQIGSPKGVARFVQRAGRSGHQPGAESKIYFVPTHSMELVEAAALRDAIRMNKMEPRYPFIRSFDVLIQYLLTLAVSDGFFPDEIHSEVKSTFSYQSMTDEEWAWCLEFLLNGGSSLQAYDEYSRVGLDKQGRFRVLNKYIARRHKLSIGTIVGDVSIQIKYSSGRKIGTVEEYFISRLRPGDVFWFAGKSLELIQIKGMVAKVRKASSKRALVPSWQGGRIPLTSQMSELIRLKIDQVHHGDIQDAEMEALSPLFHLQREFSYIQASDQLLIESFQSEDGYHVLLYPFEGRLVHEGMAALFAFRLSVETPQSFSMAMNDYALELLSDQPIDLEPILSKELFRTEKLEDDIQRSVNEIEMARKRFRDIASISGLIFQGFPGKEKKERHLQSSSGLLFEVFGEYEPDNLLYLQAFEEARIFQLEEGRLRQALKRIQEQEITISYPDKVSPFAFPIIVDRLREKLTSEKLSDRIERMTVSS